jgi:predicted MFS family arabinose efflux permease
VLVLAAAALPPLRGHLAQAHLRVSNAWAVLTDPNHLRAFALTSMLILSSFMLGPYLATFLVYNIGVQQGELKFMYVCGGIATLVTMTVFGRLADRFGKLLVFRILAIVTLAPIVIVTNLPAGLSLPLVLAVTTLFMVATSGRWVPAMALIAGSAAPAYRGSFMSFNSAVQQIAAGLATEIAGCLLDEHEDHTLTGFPLVGLLTCVASVASVYLAGRLRRDPGGELAPDHYAVTAVEEAC